MLLRHLPGLVPPCTRNMHIRLAAFHFGYHLPGVTCSTRAPISPIPPNVKIYSFRPIRHIFTSVDPIIPSNPVEDGDENHLERKGKTMLKKIGFSAVAIGTCLWRGNCVANDRVSVRFRNTEKAHDNARIERMRIEERRERERRLEQQRFHNNNRALQSMRAITSAKYKRRRPGSL